MSYYYVYILYSSSADKYYVGSSSNPWKRLKQHNTVPYNTFTSKYRPWELRAVYRAGNTRSTAEGYERFIKRQKSRWIIRFVLCQVFRSVCASDFGSNRASKNGSFCATLKDQVNLSCQKKTRYGKHT